MPHPRLAKVAAVAGACACVGAGAGVLGSASAENGNGAPAGAAGAKAVHQKHHGRHHGGPLGRAVHVDAVVPNGRGGFATATVDRGFVQSVSGDRLTLREGTRRATYKTVTVTIPAGARVRDNKRTATLADVKPGQHAVVMRLPKRTVVRAHDARRR